MRVLSAMEESTTKDLKRSVKNDAVLPKKAKLNEELEDLNENNSYDLKGAELNLTHIDRYFQGLKSNINKTSTSDLALQTQDPKLHCQNTLNEILDWKMNVKKLNNPSLAISILVDLSPGSQLMQNNGIQNLKGFK